MPILVVWHDFFTLNICTLPFEAQCHYICTVHVCVKSIWFWSVSGISCVICHDSFNIMVGYLIRIYIVPRIV